ncbi:MAG: ATP-binding cassette domain-containing protein [Bacteroidetes bacterium]|nr:MAG: ATP-binding cassette domain-containing protein [Bacteroidota bacterium]
MKTHLRYTPFYWLICLLVLAMPQTTGQSPRLRVLATTTILADLAQSVAGPHAEVQSLMPTGGDPHVYDPVPGDARKVAEADLILRNGLKLEGWLDEMIEQGSEAGKIVTVSQGVKPIQSADHPEAYDPHAWMNVRHAMRYVENIRDALVLRDPMHAAAYRQQAQVYLEQLAALDAYILAQIQRIPEARRILATSHDAFRYYGNRYGLQVVSILGTSTDAEARIEDYQALAAVIREHQIPAVFIESTLNPKLLQQMAEDLGVVIGGKLYADSLGDPESGAATYLDMLRQNTDLIVAGLTRPLPGAASDQSLRFLWVVLGAFALAFGWLVWRLWPAAPPSVNWDDYKVEIRGLSVSYGRKTALANVYLDLEPGYIYGLIGGNGSGKSTLFMSVLGLIPADAGTVRIHGQKIEEVRKHIAYIPQKEEIDWTFPATVMDIVLMGRYPYRGVFDRLQKVDREKALEALDMLGIGHIRDKQIGELSGGQQQRVFIARALCQEAQLYFFDEPFVGVDIATESRIMEIVRDLAAQGKFVIIIHHDLAKVREYFDRLIMMNQRVVAAGDTEAVFTDENIRTTYGGRLTILQKTDLYR